MMLKVIRFQEDKISREADAPSRTQKNRLTDAIYSLDNYTGDDASKLEELKEDVE